MLRRKLYRQKGILFIVVLLQVIISSYAQENILLSGKIADINNVPLPGVSVSIEGVYEDPAISDENGHFEIEISSGIEWIIVTPIGNSKGKRIFLNNRKELFIYLTPSDLESGYDQVSLPGGKDIKRDLIASVNSLSPDESFSVPTESVDQLFQGKIPGLLATGNSGMPGSGMNTYLRGIKSLYTNNQPLFIVDGFPMESPGLFNSQIDGFIDNPLANLDPLDITSITVLKDYSSAVTYGMRASNGVVLIETLQPTEVQTIIDFACKTGFSQQPVQIPQLNAFQYKSLANEILFTSGIAEEEAEQLYYPLYSKPGDEGHYMYEHNTNWQDLIFSDGISNDLYLRVRGGDEIAKYGLSVGYLDHQGVFKNTDFSRFNVRFVGTFNIFQRLRMFVNFNLNTNNSELRESARVIQTSPVLTSLFKAPILNPYQFDDDGQELITLSNVGPLGVSNPQAITDKFEAGIRNYQFTTSARVEGDITDHLTWNSYLGLDFNSMTEAVFMPNAGMQLYYEGEVYNVSESLKNYFNSIYNDNYLAFEKEFSKIHSVQAATGIRIQLNKFQVDWGIGKNSHERDEYKQLQDGTNYLREMGGENAVWNRLTYYNSAKYGLLDRYYLSAGMSMDYSSRIGNHAEDLLYLGNHPFGVFYSLGAAWRLSAEPILRDIRWLDDLKLRFSYGSAGNDYIGNYSAKNYYRMAHYRETTGMVPGPINDETVKFEKNYQLNGGLDMSIIAGRLQASFDLFNIKTEDLLVFEPQPTFTGFSLIPSNNGAIINKGYELSLFSRILVRNKFTLDLGLNLARLINRLESIKDGEIENQVTGGSIISRIGSPIINFYGYEYLGVFATTDEAEAEGLRNADGMAFSAGDAHFKDVSGPDGVPDRIIDDYDKTIIGSPIPDYYGGVSLHLGYGKWSLETNFQFVRGNELFNYVRYCNESMTGLFNQSAAVVNRWFSEGQETEIPRALWNDPVGNTSFSSRWIEDGSYVRIKHVTLAYAIPEKFLFLRNMKVFVTASNLFTWSNYLGYDPEFSYSYNIMNQGIDYGLMPHTRKFIVGIKLGL